MTNRALFLQDHETTWRVRRGASKLRVVAKQPLLMTRTRRCETRAVESGAWGNESRKVDRRNVPYFLSLNRPPTFHNRKKIRLTARRPSIQISAVNILLAWLNLKRVPIIIIIILFFFSKLNFRAHAPLQIVWGCDCLNIQHHQIWMKHINHKIDLIVTKILSIT